MLHLIQRQCKPRSSTRLNFFVGGQILKLCLREFALITRLICGKYQAFNRDKVTLQEFLPVLTFFPQRMHCRRQKWSFLDATTIRRLKYTIEDVFLTYIWPKT